MAKPDDVPVFATDTNYPAGSQPWSGMPTKVEPPAGTQVKGFEPRRRPPAQYLNWLLHTIYLWLLWLDGLWGADGTLTLDADADVIVSGTGGFCHGLRTIKIPAIAGHFDTSAYAPTWFTTDSGGIEVTTSSSTFERKIPIVLSAGKRILAVRFLVKDHATGPTTIACDVIRYSSYDTNQGSIGSGNVLSAGTGADQTLTLPDVSHTVLAGNTYIASALVISGSATPIYVYAVEVDYDRPPA